MQWYTDLSVCCRNILTPHGMILVVVPQWLSRHQVASKQRAFAHSLRFGKSRRSNGLASTTFFHVWNFRPFLHQLVVWGLQGRRTNGHKPNFSLLLFEVTFWNASNSTFKMRVDHGLSKAPCTDDWMPQSFGSAPGHYFRVSFCHQGFVSQSTLKMMSQQLFFWCFCNPFCSHRCCIVNHSQLMHSKAYLQVFRRLLDEPLPSKPADQKIPIWETLGHILGSGCGEFPPVCGMVICDWMELDWPIIWNLLSWMRWRCLQ